MSFQIKYIYDLVDRISPDLRKIRKNLTKTQKVAQKVARKAALAFKKFGTQLNKVGLAATRLGKSLFLRVTVPIALLGAAFIKAASDAEETRSKFATVFQDVAKESEDTADRLAKDFGLSGVKTRELLGDTGDLLTGFGFTGKSALTLSRRVNELAVDLASFTNFSGGAEGASKALTKALLGERESVKSLGIAILEKDVKAKIKALAVTGALRGMTLRQAKAFATLEIAIEQSKNAIGDYARTSDAFANKIRLMNARLFDLKVLMGEILLPIATKLVNKIIELTEKFNKLSPKTKKIILIVAGLAAVMAPLLIIIGATIAAIKILTATFLLNPFGLALVSIGLLVAGFFLIKKRLKDLGLTFRDLPLLVINAFSRIGKKIEESGTFGKIFIELMRSVGEIINFVFKSIGVGFKILKTIFLVILETIKAVTEGIKILIEPILKLNNLAVKGIGKAVDFGKDFFGGKSNQQNINTTTILNKATQNQTQAPTTANVGGRFDINFINAPKGINAAFTPAPGNKLDIGINSIAAGG